MNNILDFESRKIAVKKMPETKYAEPEMSEFESAFLCGCLRKFKPKKILELGIAGGGDDRCNSNLS